MTVKITHLLDNKALDVEKFIYDINMSPLNDSFSNDNMAFVAAFVQKVLSDVRIENLPDLKSLCFWFRSQRLKALARSNEGKRHFRRGIGICLHIAPSNVDTISMYSGLLSLLCGNPTIVRIPNFSSPSVRVILEAFKQLKSDARWSSVFDMFQLIYYPSDSDITERLSKISALRVVWGGDDTVNNIRQLDITPLASEISFADRYSLAVFQSSRVLDLTKNELKSLAARFYTDAFLFGQQGCSSPRSVFWVGTHTEIKQAQNLFWDCLKDKALTTGNSWEPSEKMSRYVNTLEFIATGLGYVDSSVDSYKDPFVVIDLIDPLLEIHRDMHGGFGLFTQLNIETLDQAFNLMSQKDQTLVAFGFDEAELRDSLEKCKSHCVNRIVSPGRALDFDEIWDGQDLLGRFTNHCLIF